jgi:Cyclophilin type peptidyl-prolyl cis-trans isomerase/CLD
VSDACENLLRLRSLLQLRDDISPRTAAYVKQVAAGGLCNNSTSCRFYRAEPIPPPGAIDNFGGPGPPYALVQGSLASTLFTAIEREGAPLVQRGDACLIGTGPDFFIAVGPHPEWGNGHTVWGRVQGSMAAVDAIVEQPLKEETWGETHVRVLVSPMPFTLSTHAV